ncbi:hypothetical protein [Kordiimonas sp.]|uniref:hypothetical protein n=1 Tax=Kordiimonas sp. TaxID=1970157 RepID=UPI003A8FA17B
MAIVYFAPATDKAIGGVKVIYQHAALLAEQGVEACVFHPEQPDFTCSWFDHGAEIKRDTAFNLKDDFFVVPDVWAGTTGLQCMAKRMHFGIFVQNGYLLSEGRMSDGYDSLSRAYEAADVILSISDDTTEMIRLAFPQLPSEKIMRVQLSIGPAFRNRRRGNKQKLLSYMPRRLPQHSKLLRFFLRPYLPQGWQFAAIDGAHEAEVAAALSASSVFLSFSSLEGVGLPPLEAALSGNVVVGYTGEAGKEYFRPPLFRAVDSGDLKTFVQQTRAAIDFIESGKADSAAFEDDIVRLDDMFSRGREAERLLAFANSIRIPRK